MQLRAGSSLGDRAPVPSARDACCMRPRAWTLPRCSSTMTPSGRSRRPHRDRIRPMQHLTIVTTGGTIDKIYFDDKSTFQIGEPQIGDILEALGVAFTFEVLPVLRKDSLHMDDDDRARIRA